ncbi:bacteriophage protein [Salmonella enterica subsp. enterica]|uniref:Bacteriophage protein n=1 Tax=Salmonella enterica I TaxID=59201 RepID=A0A379WA47_SALET|nr:bacteriophage protein [Salmonella enterica subsp. enterica]
MAHELQLIKQSSGILIPATPETSDILQSKIKLGAVLVAEFRQVRNPAFHRRFFALLNLGFEYWEPTGGAISANERKLVTVMQSFSLHMAGMKAHYWMRLNSIWNRLQTAG